MKLRELQTESIDKCFTNPSSKHMDIMKEMIEKAYHEGRKQGQREMSKVARRNLSDLIPTDLDY